MHDLEYYISRGLTTLEHIREFVLYKYPDAEFTIEDTGYYYSLQVWTPYYDPFLDNFLEEVDTAFMDRCNKRIFVIPET